MQMLAALLARLRSPAPSVPTEFFPPEGVHSIYTGDLTREAVHHIIRHLSSTPRAEHWTFNVPTATVHALFLADEPFRAVASSIFDSMTTVSGSLLYDAPPTSRGAMVSIATDADHEKLGTLIESAGASLVSLKVLHSWQEPLSPSLKCAWAVSAAAHCSSLRELSVAVSSTGRCPVYVSLPQSSAFSSKGIRFVHPALVNLLTARGDGLEALTLHGPSMPVQITEAVSVYCRRLRRLRIDVDEWDGLTAAPLLRCVGEDLTDLALVAPRASDMIPALQAAKNVCTQLQRLEVRGLYGAREMYRRVVFSVGVPDLICGIVDSNGASLLTLALSADLVQVPLLDGVVAAWPDVSFDVEVTGDKAPKVLPALDGRIVKLNIFAFDETTSAQDLDCSRLETLVVNGPYEPVPACTAKVLRALAAKVGLPSLRHARIAFGQLTPVDEEVAALAVLEAGGLHSLHLKSMWIPAGAIETVAKANPGLVEVSLLFQVELPGGLGDELTGLIASFCKFCPSLTTLKIGNPGCHEGTYSEVIANACNPLRTRGVSVSVMGVQYLE